MKTYNILYTESLTSPIEKKLIAIEEKTSIIAFLFQAFWLLYHKIWTPAIIVILTNIILSMSLKKGLINNTIFNSLEVIIALIIAIFANSWYIDKLKNSGYQLDIIAAKNSEEAKLKFYQQYYKQEGYIDGI